MAKLKIYIPVLSILIISLNFTDLEKAIGANNKEIFAKNWYSFSISQDLSNEKNLNKLSINGVVNFKDCQTKATGVWSMGNTVHRYSFIKSESMNAEAVNADSKGYVPVDAIYVENPPLLTVVNTILDVEKDRDKRGVACSFKIFEKYGYQNPTGKEINLSKDRIEKMISENMKKYIENLNLSISTRESMLDSTKGISYGGIISKLKIELIENKVEIKFNYFRINDKKLITQVVFKPTNIQKIENLKIKSFDEDYKNFNKNYRTDSEKTKYIEEYVKNKRKASRTGISK
jgi:hypothetical protein